MSKEYISKSCYARTGIEEKLTLFLIEEARACSMDFGCVTPLYVYRMWGGSVAIDEIEKALVYLRANNYGC